MAMRHSSGMHGEVVRAGTKRGEVAYKVCGPEEGEAPDDNAREDDRRELRDGSRSRDCDPDDDRDDSRGGGCYHDQDADPGGGCCHGRDADPDGGCYPARDAGRDGGYCLGPDAGATTGVWMERTGRCWFRDYSYSSLCPGRKQAVRVLHRW